jgi:hypothetical protein
VVRFKAPLLAYLAAAAEARRASRSAIPAALTIRKIRSPVANSIHCASRKEDVKASPAMGCSSPALSTYLPPCYSCTAILRRRAAANHRSYHAVRCWFRIELRRNRQSHPVCWVSVPELGSFWRAEPRPGSACRHLGDHQAVVGGWGDRFDHRQSPVVGADSRDPSAVTRPAGPSWSTGACRSSTCGALPMVKNPSGKSGDLD